MRKAEFQVDIGADAARQFAELSGDWNPLHTDDEYASTSVYGKPILHGAYSAGLVSRLAGMDLPGKECLLYEIKLRFVAPIQPPARLKVSGREVSPGQVVVTISDAHSGLRYVDAEYRFGEHDKAVASEDLSDSKVELNVGDNSQSVVVVTGASGGLAGCVLDLLKERGLGVSRSGERPNTVRLDDIDSALGDRQIEAVVHCGWPLPDNRTLLELDDVGFSIAAQVTSPLSEAISWAQFLSKKGKTGASLVLVGSTFSRPGRHNFGMPLYTLGKSFIAPLTNILALELGMDGQRCIGLEFDVLKGGMNKGLNAATFQAHADRTPSGELGSLEDAAGQIIWALDNSSQLVSGAMITLSGGALP